MPKNLKVLLDWTITAAGIWVDQTTCPRSFCSRLLWWVRIQHCGARWSYQRWYNVDTLREHLEHYLLADMVDTEGWLTYVQYIMLPVQYIMLLKPWTCTLDERLSKIRMQPQGRWYLFQVPSAPLWAPPTPLWMVEDHLVLAPDT